MSQVRSILSKLDRTRSASRGRPAGAATNDVTPSATRPEDEAPIDSDTLIGAPKQMAHTPTKSVSAPPDPARPGAQFGRAKPIPFRS
ncbi:MAG: hypothetical protein AAGK04_14385 [Planctomycetota bacterium]